jgi:hypothetical protein
VDFLKSWVRSLYMPSYEDLNYPPGLQITNLSCVLRYAPCSVLFCDLAPLVFATSEATTAVLVN